MVAIVPLALTALLSGASLPAQTVPPIPLIAAEQPPLPIDALMFGDDASRMTVPVSIGERGPYEFVVDTGAQRTVVSHDLAGLLGLRPGRRVRVTAMTSVAVVDTVQVPSLTLSKIAAAAIEAPALDQTNMGAPGMLGIDALQGRVVSIDFDRHEMAVRPSRKRSQRFTPPGEVVVTARSRFGQLIVTDAHWHNERVSVVVDTGTAVTVANPAFFRMLGKAWKPLGKVGLISALGEFVNADYISVDRLQIGEVTFHDVPVAIEDAEPFHRFDLVDRPALLLGMDALRLFRNVEIDFANREIRFSMPVALIAAN
ncbi:MAG TPA: retroviral-like aspartic protease family protein [Sphingomonas sp.]|nr:retroviral-like aspartic protease family protein [Sphingomonas sp.]